MNDVFPTHHEITSYFRVRAKKVYEDASQLRGVDLLGLVIITVHNFIKSFHVAKIQESSVHFVLGSLYWSKGWWHAAAFPIPTVSGSAEALALVLS